MDKEKCQWSKLIFDSKDELYNELVSINDSIPYIIEEVISEINNHDPTILEFWEQEGLKPKLVTYLMHYVIPFYELLCYEKKGKNINLLAIELLSCFAWRTFDNCVDAHEAPKKAHLTSLLSCMHIVDYAQSHASEHALVNVKYHYSIMAEQTLRETTEPIWLNDIWKRCSIFIYAPDTLAKLSATSISIFKNYINYTGLAHDMHDLVSDISGGVISLPIFWMREINLYGVLNVEVVKALYEKARNAVKPIEDSFSEINIENRLPIINRLSKEAWQIFHKE